MIVDGVLRNQAVDTTREAIELLRGEMSVPAFQPPVQSIFIGEDETIVLRREESGAASQRWDLINRLGNPAGRISLPRSARPVWLSGTVLWTVQPDENDVPWLVKYNIAR